jgi:hypothetical protein
VELLLFLGDLERGGQRSRRTYGGCWMSLDIVLSD